MRRLCEGWEGVNAIQDLAENVYTIICQYLIKHFKSRAKRISPNMNLAFSSEYAKNLFYQNKSFEFDIDNVQVNTGIVKDIRKIKIYLWWKDRFRIETNGLTRPSKNSMDDNGKITIDYIELNIGFRKPNYWVNKGVIYTSEIYPTLCHELQHNYYWVKTYGKNMSDNDNYSGLSQEDINDVVDSQDYGKNVAKIEEIKSLLSGINHLLYATSDNEMYAFTIGGIFNNDRAYQFKRIITLTKQVIERLHYIANNCDEWNSMYNTEFVSSLAFSLVFSFFPELETYYNQMHSHIRTNDSEEYKLQASLNIINYVIRFFEKRKSKMERQLNKINKYRKY